MPIFEADESVTSEEMKRQQKLLNEKVFRKQSAEFMHDVDTEAPQNGDCWLEEPLDEDQENEVL